MFGRTDDDLEARVERLEELVDGFDGRLIGTDAAEQLAIGAVHHAVVDKGACDHRHCRMIRRELGIENGEVADSHGQ